MKQKSNPKLTVKQRSFIDNYLANGSNGTQAAKSAGYKGSDNTLAQVANENLKKPHVKAEIDAALEKISKDLQFTAEWKRKKLGEVIERCMQAEPVMIHEDGKWVESGEYAFKAKEVISAIAELNKMDGDLAAIKTKNEHSFVDHVSKLEAARARAKGVKS